MNPIEAISKDSDTNVDQIPHVDIDQEQIPNVLKHKRTYSIIMALVNRLIADYNVVA